MSSAIHWFKDKFYFCKVQLEFSLARQSSTPNGNRKIQQMALDIGWGVMAEGLKGSIYTINVLSQWVELT